MPFFVDTSALFKRYQVEAGTAKINELLENARGDLFISSLTIIEVISNLKRLFEIDHLTTEEHFREQRLFFYHDIENLGVTALDITAEDIIRADELILKRYMKPVDAVQLAVSINNFSDRPTFVSADQKLCDIAKSEGIPIINPAA